MYKNVKITGKGKNFRRKTDNGSQIKRVLQLFCAKINKLADNTAMVHHVTARQG